MKEIDRFIQLEGLVPRKRQDKASGQTRIVVVHDEVVTCGKGRVQRLIEQLKKQAVE